MSRRWRRARRRQGSAPCVETLLDAGARFVGKTHTAELAFSLDGRNSRLGTPTNPGGAGAGAGRLVVRLGGGRGGRPCRHRARQRHRRLGARAGVVLRPRRPASDPRPDRHFRRHAARAEPRHGRLVHPRHRALRAGRRGDARRRIAAGPPLRRMRPGRRCVRGADVAGRGRGAGARRRAGEGRSAGDRSRR